MILVRPSGSKCLETWGKRKFWLLSSVCLNGHFLPFLQPLRFPKKGQAGLAACNAATNSSGIESSFLSEEHALGFSVTIGSEPGWTHSPSESENSAVAAIDMPALDASIGLLARIRLDEDAAVGLGLLLLLAMAMTNNKD